MAEKLPLRFDDKSANSIAYECEGTERLRTSVEAGVPSLFANRAGMLALAKVLVKIGMCDYKNGSHLYVRYVRSDFSGDAAEPDVLTILLDESGTLDSASLALNLDRTHRALSERQK